MDLGKPWVVRGLVVALALVVGAVVWMALREGGDEGEGAPTPVAAEGRLVDEAELADVAATAGYPVYWAGPVAGTQLEVTESAGGILVRYLAEGVEATEEAVRESLAVGSYPLPDPQASLDGFAAAPGAIVHRGGGQQVVGNRDSPGSLYFVPPGNQVQVEVYDPDPQRALQLIRSGQIVPVG